jgi:hypothetical protein
MGVNSQPSSGRWLLFSGHWLTLPSSQLPEASDQRPLTSIESRESTIGY